MGCFKIIALFAVVAITAVALAQPTNGVLDSDDIALLGANWTTCDITTTPVISCSDCKTRLICKPIGGLLISCHNPYRPYCVHGVCSPVPSDECAEDENE